MEKRHQVKKNQATEKPILSHVDTVRVFCSVSPSVDKRNKLSEQTNEAD